MDLFNGFDFKELDFENAGSWPAAFKNLIFSFVFIGILLAAFWYDTTSQMDQISAAKQKEVELTEEFEVKYLRASKLAEYKRQLAVMAESLTDMLNQLPGRTEVAKLLIDISHAGVEAGLEFEKFKPEGEVLNDFYAELPVELRIVGSYHQIGQFISEVSSLSRIVTLHDFKVQPHSEQRKLLTMDINAKTYRYLDEEEVARIQREKALMDVRNKSASGRKKKKG